MTGVIFIMANYGSQLPHYLAFLTQKCPKNYHDYASQPLIIVSIGIRRMVGLSEPNEPI